MINLVGLAHLWACYAANTHPASLTTEPDKFMHRQQDVLAYIMVSDGSLSPILPATSPEYQLLQYVSDMPSPGAETKAHLVLSLTLADACYAG